MRLRLPSLLVLGAAAVLLLGCSDDDGSDGRASGDSEEVTDAAPEPGAVASTSTTAGGTPTSQPATAAPSSAIQPLLDLGFTEEQAECVITEALATDVDILGEVDQDLVDLFASCDITARQLAAIGLGTSPDDVSQQLELLTSAITPELQAALRDSPEARSALVDLFVAQGLPHEASECAVQALIDLEDLAVLSDVDALLGLFIDCDVSLGDLTALG